MHQQVETECVDVHDINQTESVAVHDNNYHVDVPITSSKANLQKTKTRDDEKQITFISELLKEISLEQYIEVFAKEMIDLQMLLNLKPEQFMENGDGQGHRDRTMGTSPSTQRISRSIERKIQQKGPNNCR